MLLACSCCIGDKQQKGLVFHRTRKHGHVSTDSPWPGARFCYNSNICLGISFGKYFVCKLQSVDLVFGLDKDQGILTTSTTTTTTSESLDKVKFSGQYKFLSLVCVSTCSLVISSFSSPYSKCSAKLLSLVTKLFIHSPGAGVAPRKFCLVFGMLFFNLK